jgi:elongation factor G
MHPFSYNEVYRNPGGDQEMTTTATDLLRNIVLLSHSGAGKTLLGEAMLHSGGVIDRFGRTEDGTTASDYEEEEIKRQGSVQLSILRCPWNNHQINIIDTPGYADFRGEVISGARVADAAVFVVEASAGVEVGTQQTWQIADQQKLPRLIFINKMDRENADFQRTMESITESFGRQCVAIQIPVGADTSFTGTISVLDPNTTIPEDLQETVESAREALTEAAAETDDELTMKYLEGESLSDEEIRQGIRKGVASGSVVPVLVGAAAQKIGAKELMEAIVDFIPSPSESDAISATDKTNGNEISLPRVANGPLAALVFKTSADAFVGKLSYVKVLSGTLKSDSQLWNTNAEETERVGQAFVLNGKMQESVDQLLPGDIGAIAKLNSVLTGHTLGDKDTPLVLPDLEFPRPVYDRAIYPKSKADLDKMTTALARIAEEDPSLKIRREPITLELVLAGLGDTHVSVATEKMKRKFGVEIILKQPKVPYKESISSATKVEYRHKKQSGGSGQFGHVWLEIQPLPRGSGFEFDVKVVGGSVPREYIPSVEKGVRQSLSDGAIAGFPIVDLKATLVDGSSHSVDSSGISFEIAGNRALSKGVREASPTLLEPILHAKITVPDNYSGDIIGDLNGKRGKILGMNPLGDGTSEIESEVPQSEMQRYATDLRSQTQGRGSFTVEFAHYEEVPAHLVERLVDETKDPNEAKI